MEPFFLRLPNGRRIEINQWNCHVFIFSDEWRNYDHIYAWDIDEEPFYIFDNRLALRLLLDSELFPYTWAPEPNDQDKEMFARWWANKSPITNSEVLDFIEQLDEGVIPHWDELEGGEE